MNKVLLINTNTEKTPYPVPPLGLCLLASAIEGQFDVKVYDGVFDEGKNLVSLVESFHPDFIGFSIRNIDDVVIDRPNYYVDGIISSFIDPVKKITHVPIILGGSGFSVFPKEIMQLSGADYGIIGEAVETFPELLNCLITGKDPSGIPGLIIKENLRKGKGREVFFQNLLGYKFSEIDRHIDFKPYLTKGAYSIQTKRGCAHNCIYCNYPLIEGKKFRIRKPSEVADEIAQASERLGPVTFEFVDSTFNDPTGHAEEICREIIKRKLMVRLRTMGINPRNTSDILFNLMKEAGFGQIDATPDSASPILLKNLKKGFTLKEVQKMAQLIRKHDLPTMWFFLFGGPGENEKTFYETIRFIDEFVNPDDLVYMNYGLRIYPGTPLYSIALKEGKIRNDQSLLYPPLFYFSDYLPKQRIIELIREAASTRYNCIPATDTKPPPEMMQEALKMRQSQNLKEPMFRTLLRIRRSRITMVKKVSERG